MADADFSGDEILFLLLAAAATAAGIIGWYSPIFRVRARGAAANKLLLILVPSALLAKLCFLRQCACFQRISPNPVRQLGTLTASCKELMCSCIAPAKSPTALACGPCM